MTNRIKVIFGTIATIGILFFTVIGIQTIWTEYITKDYDSHLNEKVYVDTVIKKNINLVFYKKGCSICKASKRDVISIAEDSSYPTFYIDVESKEGRSLVQKYHIKKAATIIQIREGLEKEFSYARKSSTGDIEINTSQIEEALN